MSQKILQVNAKLVAPPEQFERENGAEVARFFADVPGLLWKIWLLNRETGEAGGIYLFADETTFAEYVNGPIVAQLKDYPLWSDLDVKSFDYLPVPSAVTRAPVGDSVLGRNGAPKTFNSMVGEALQTVPAITPAEARRRQQEEPDLLLIDVRDAADIAQTGTAPGAINISYGALTYMADNEVPEEWRDPRLADRSRPIITTCILGPLGALGGKLLHDMGFTNVRFLEGGIDAWAKAELPLAENGAG